MAVYFIRAGYSGPVKIGYTGGPPGARIMDLQSAHYETLILIRGISQGTKDLERWFHKRFADWHIRGEWFHYCEEMLADEPAAAENHTSGAAA